MYLLTSSTTMVPHGSRGLDWPHHVVRTTINEGVKQYVHATWLSAGFRVLIHRGDSDLESSVTDMVPTPSWSRMNIVRRRPSTVFPTKLLHLYTTAVDAGSA